MRDEKLGLIPLAGIRPLWLFWVHLKLHNNHEQSSNFFGQPIYGQLTKSLDREKIIGISRKHGGEKYVKSFDGYTHLLTMLYAVIQRNGTKKWIKQLRIIDSTTITLFSNAIFKGVGRHPKSGKKKGGIKVHSVIHANEGVPCDVQFTSASTNNSFMLAPSHYGHNEIIALDRAYISYDKFEELTDRAVVYVTKMKKNLNYEVRVDCMPQNP